MRETGHRESAGGTVVRIGEGRERGCDETIAPRRLRRPGCFWGRRGHISLFG